MSNRVIYSSTGYFDLAWDNPSMVVESMRAHLKGVKYDTLVGTGMSGSLIVPVLARALRKNFLIIRKEQDTDNHHGNPWIGRLGKRWVFVDDFVSSGNTYQRVVEQVDKMVEWNNSFAWLGHFDGSTHVGVYEYNREMFTFARYRADGTLTTRRPTTKEARRP